MSVRLHVDTDLGSDPDDACALAMLLGLEQVELVGVTTTVDPGGVRAGLVHELLRLAGHADLPVAAGAEVTIAGRDTPGGIPTGEPWWPGPVPARPSPPGAALDSLAAAVTAGATVLAIGPLTNLALLETLRPGSLARTPVVVMGGWVGGALPAGYPDWSAERDWNVQCDPYAAQVVFTAAAELTIVPIAATVAVPVRAADLAELAAVGPLGALLAAQTRAHGQAYYAGFGARYPALPDDLVNFHHDPLAGAVAAGWDGVALREQRVRVVAERGVLRLEPDAAGRPVRVAAEPDAERFRRDWLAAVSRASRRAARR